jgi:putative autoinducer-2 (AI-2) aldolase
MAYRAIEDGAAGVDMGRNIFQSGDPVAMIRAVSAVVHDSVKPQAAYDHYLTPSRPAGPRGDA